MTRDTAMLALVALCIVDREAGATPDGVVTGEITIVRNGQKLADHANVVVYLENVPAGASTTVKHAIRQQDLQFSPRISVVVKGTTVDFPNQDRIFHNVFSASRPARFDLGLYRSGSSKSVQFKREGVVDVFCNIHPEMSSRVLVVPTHHFATTDSKGVFKISGVPPGTYPVVVWHPNGMEVRKQLVIEAGKVAKLTAQIEEGEKPKQHRRKDGTPYGRYE